MHLTEAGYSNLSLRVFRHSELTDIYLACTDAFEDYQFPVQFTLEEFRYKFMTRLQTRLELSAGVWHKEKLVAFTLVSCFEDQCYLSCLGVRKDWRRIGLSKKLLAFQEELVAHDDSNELILDVLGSNDVAVSVYEQAGYQIIRKLTTYSISRDIILKSQSFPHQIVPADHVPWEEVYAWRECELPFLNGRWVIRPGVTHDSVLSYRDEKGTGGVIVFDKHNGRIPLLMVRPDLRRQGLGKALLREAAQLILSKEVICFNIPEEASGINSFLSNMEFRKYFNQVEMKKSIC